MGQSGSESTKSIKTLWYAPLILLIPAEKFSSGKRWWRGTWTKNEDAAGRQLKKELDEVLKQGKHIQNSLVMVDASKESKK